MRLSIPILALAGCAEAATNSSTMMSADSADEEPADGVAPSAEPAAVLWYEHAEPSRPACRTASFFGTRHAVAAACHWMFRHSGRPQCIDDPIEATTSCGDELLEWFGEMDSANAFVGGEFSALITAHGSAFRLHFASGERASCSQAYFGAITLCVSGTPQRR